MKITLVGSRYFGATAFDAIRKEGIAVARVVVPAADDRLAQSRAGGRRRGRGPRRPEDRAGERRRRGHRSHRHRALATRASAPRRSRARVWAASATTRRCCRGIAASRRSNGRSRGRSDRRRHRSITWPSAWTPAPSRRRTGASSRRARPRASCGSARWRRWDSGCWWRCCARREATGALPAKPQDEQFATRAPMIPAPATRPRRRADPGDTTMRVFNFSAGPAVLPEAVLRQAAAEMLDWHGSGMSVMEMSHRGKEFIGIAAKAEADLRTLLAIPAELQGAVPAGRRDRRERDRPDEPARAAATSADYVNTGEWSKKSIKEAKKYCTVNVAASRRGPELHLRAAAGDAGSSTPAPAYVHVCTNETIGGVEYQWTPDTGDVPLVADMSSHILSRVDRRGEVRRDLRRRAEEHGPGGPDAGDRPRRPARPRAADHAVGVPLEGAGRGRLDAQHAADLCDLHRRAGVRMAARAGRRSRRSSAGTSPRRRCSTTISTERRSTAPRCARRTARG